MAAQQAHGVGVAQAGYRSEDEDSTVEYSGDQFLDYPDPVVTIQKDPILQADDWTNRDAQGWEYYIPPWTRPGYDDKTEVKPDGTMERPRRGDPFNRMRPALLPNDPPASQYARRFGIFSDQNLNDNSEARSMLTPASGSTSARPDDGGIEWGLEQSFQAIFNNSFTSKELSDLGVFDPNQIVQRPDLDGDIHYLFTRDKWTQQPHRQNANDHSTIMTYDFWYNLNGEKKPWDVQQNDELWDALQPALSLATKVLLSGHPFWEAILSVYHLRPVPVEKDGRTREQKADPTYRRYISVWYEVDPDKMYYRARALRDKGFDSAAATLEALNRLLKFSIVRTDEGASASTRFGGTDPGWQSIRIVLNAAYIWALLVPQYSASEKISASFYVAKIILHELAHATRYAHEYLVFFPEIVFGSPTYVPPTGTRFDQDIVNDLQGLGFEAFTIPSTQFLFQDIPQMEEGKSFDEQAWGYDASIGPDPAPGKLNDAFHGYIYTISWPWKHPNIHLQNQRSVDARKYGDHTDQGYSTFLLDPPAAAYNIITPIPVSSYAKFMQKSWWDGDFTKFGHQALRIPIHTTDVASPMKSFARPEEWLGGILPFLTTVIRSRLALDFIVNYASPTLFDHGQTFILFYLTLLTREGVAASLLRNRLHYEKLTWPNRVRGIQGMSTTTSQSFDTLWDFVGPRLHLPVSGNTVGDIYAVVARTRNLSSNLIELKRLLGVEIQYCQAITAQYILNTPEARKKIHRRYIRFLQRTLLHIRNAVVAVVDKITPMDPGEGLLQSKTIADYWENSFTQLVQTNPVDLSENAQRMLNNAISQLADTRKEAEQACADLELTISHVDNISPILGDQYISFPIATAPNGLFPGVPIARKIMQTSKAVENAAVSQILRLKDSRIDGIIQQWIKILEAHVGLRDRMQGTADSIKMERSRADLAAIMPRLFELKQTEDPPATQQGGRTPRDLTLTALRAQITLLVGDDERLRTWLRDFCHRRNDEEEYNTIMSMASQTPASQQDG